MGVGESVSPLLLAPGLQSHYASHCVFVGEWPIKRLAVGIRSNLRAFADAHSRRQKRGRGVCVPSSSAILKCPTIAKLSATKRC